VKTTKGKKMKTLQARLKDERGQGLMEYTLVVFLVTISFWLGVRGTTFGDQMANVWIKTTDCLSEPFSCG
jgi:Flp pilus assembly pilin Flp